MICLVYINKLYRIDEFTSEVCYTTEFNGGFDYNATKMLPVFSI